MESRTKPRENPDYCQYLKKMLNRIKIEGAPSIQRICFSSKASALLWCEIQGLRACLHGGGGPQVGEVTRLGRVPTCLYNLSY